MKRDFAPRLGILSGDAPSHRMVVVKFCPGTTWKWAYVTPGHGLHEAYTLRDESVFTPLSDFGVHATMTVDAQLALHQLTFSTARYPDGTPRPWQGAAEAKLLLVARHAGWVVDAVWRDFEARRGSALMVETRREARAG